MDRIRKLALASTATTFLLVGIGGLVRATKSGLGCGDNWPHCPGEVTRAMIIESSHRAVAGLLVILLGSLAVMAWRRRKEIPSLLRPCLAAFGLVLWQAMLGAIVVWLHLEAESVVLHLATAMALFALLIYITAKTYTLDNRRAPEDASVSRSASVAATAVLALLLVGSYVTGRKAGYVFGDWPLMNGAFIPDLHIELYAIHSFTGPSPRLWASSSSWWGSGSSAGRTSYPFSPRSLTSRWALTPSSSWWAPPTCGPG